MNLLILGANSDVGQDLLNYLLKMNTLTFIWGQGN